MDGTSFSDERRTQLKAEAEARFYEEWHRNGQELQAKRAERLRESSNLGRRFKERTFESFRAELNQGAYDKCMKFVNEYPTKDSRNSLLIIGNVGTGKTHLAASIANRLLDRGIPVLFNTYSGHLQRLRSEFDSETQRHYLEQMKRVEMLVLDDIGKEKQSEWSKSVMFDVINYRYENYLPVVITSNLNQLELGEYLGKAIWSRLIETCKGAKTEGADQRRVI